MNYSSMEPLQGQIVGDRSEFINKVFTYFALILAVAATGAYIGVSLYSSNLALLSSPFVQWGPFIVLLGLTWTMHSWSERSPLNILLGSLTALICGLITAPLLLMAIGVGGLMLPVKAFVVTTCVFGAMALIGWTTKKDLSSWGGMLSIGVIAIIIVSLINAFLLQSSVLSMVMDAVVIMVFSAFTAYDIQSIKERYPDTMAVSAAFSLFLDFLNLFQSILHLLISFERD